MNEHPSKEILSQWLEGKLGDEDGAAVESHIEACDVCASAIDGFAANDVGFVEQVRGILQPSALPGDNKPTFQLPSTQRESLAREKPGMSVGPYKLMQIVGEGGMGAVWMAKQEKTRPTDGCSQDHPKPEWIPRR